MGRIVQRHDPDRFFTALFAPPARRETLFTLYATNHELARAREVVSNPMLALIRLQWWREIAEGARRRHEVAGPLGEALDEGRLLAADLLDMIEGREAEADEIEDLPAFETYLRAAYGGVAVAAGRVLLADSTALDALRGIGAAYGMAGILRSVEAMARQGRCVLPTGMLASAGLTVAEVIANPCDARLAPILRRLADHGLGWLPEGKGAFPRTAAAAWLLAVLARRDLRRIPNRPERGLADRATLIAAAAICRV